MPTDGSGWPEPLLLPLSARSLPTYPKNCFHRLISKQLIRLHLVRRCRVTSNVTAHEKIVARRCLQYVSTGDACAWSDAFSNVGRRGLLLSHGPKVEQLIADGIMTPSMSLRSFGFSPTRKSTEYIIITSYDRSVQRASSSRRVAIIDSLKRTRTNRTAIHPYLLTVLLVSSPSLSAADAGGRGIKTHPKTNGSVFQM